MDRFLLVIDFFENLEKKFAEFRAVFRLDWRYFYYGEYKCAKTEWFYDMKRKIKYRMFKMMDKSVYNFNRIRKNFINICSLIIIPCIMLNIILNIQRYDYISLNL